MGKRYRSGVGRLLPEIESAVAPHGYQRFGHVFATPLEREVVHFLLPRKLRTGKVGLSRGFYVPQALVVLGRDLPDPEQAPVGWAQGSLGNGVLPTKVAEEVDEYVAAGQLANMQLQTVPAVVERWPDRKFWAYSYRATIYPSSRDSAWLAGCLALLGRYEEAISALERALEDPSLPSGWNVRIEEALVAVRNSAAS